MLNTKPLVSIIMAVYNTEQKIFEQAVKSILNQTYKNIEVIIINDHSTVDYSSIECLRDNRIVWVENEVNLGLTKSLNKCLLLCHGEYIARMDSDDISMKTRIEEQVAYLQKRPSISILGTRAKNFGNSNAMRATIPNTPSFIKAYSIFNCTIVHPSVMIRKSFLDDNKLSYDEKYKNSQDFDLWVRCLEIGNVIEEMPKCLLYYRISNQQISSKKNNTQQIKNARVIREYQVNLIGIEPTKREIFLHNCLSEGIINDIEMSEILDWCTKLIKANFKIKYVDSNMLKLAISQQLFPIIFSKKYNFKSKINNFYKALKIVGFSLFSALIIKIKRKIIGKTTGDIQNEIEKNI